MWKNELIGNTRPLRDLLSFIKRAAQSDANILILGETGVGKELAARGIHALSARGSNPFIKLNCANLNEELLESELFGHKKGAFTSALADKPGLLEEATGGIFFLDEIGDISPRIQAKLLSVIEDKEIRRVGKNTTRIMDIQFICATNKDINELVRKGKFRIDLFFRINILSFYISPLRDRKNDIALLSNYILHKMNAKKNKGFVIDESALRKLESYSFPGNIRELENIIERGASLCKKSIIEMDDILFTPITNCGKIRKPSRFGIGHIKKVLEKSGGNKAQAAKELGISRRHIYRLIKHETMSLSSNKFIPSE